MDILNVLEAYEKDRAISSYEYHIYKPYNPGQLGKGDEIRIQVLNSDLFVQLSEAFLYVEGELTTLAANTNILTVDNFPLFLFDEMRLEINGKVIDSIKNVGLHAMMKGVLVTSKTAENYTSLHG